MEKTEVEQLVDQMADLEHRNQYLCDALRCRVSLLELQLGALRSDSDEDDGG